MAIRIQPAEVDIPHADPFANDLLNRKEPAEILTHLISSIEGPCVLSIDGAWGSGKTTFLRMWTRHLINQGFPVVTFNAWETDYSAAPFISLAAALANASQLSQGGSTSKTLERFRGLAKKIAPWMMPFLSAAALAGVGVAGADATVVGSLPQTLTSVAIARFDQFPEAQQSVEEFKAGFIEMAAETFADCGDKPLIVAIDELDRCRPTFAIELLETAKHLFMADHVVFVLSMNRSELCHSIKAVYGGGFDAEGYLRRFMDVDFRLPDVDRAGFVNDLIKRTQIDLYFQRSHDSADKRTYGEVLRSVFAAQQLSVRTISQIMHRLGLVLASMPDDRRTLIGASILALLLSATNIELYGQFIRGDALDEECADALFGSLPEEIRYSAPVAWLEALIIAASFDSIDLSTYTSHPNDTSLVGRYLNLQEEAAGQSASSARRRRHAELVLSYFERGDSWQLHPDNVRGDFRIAARRMELLSPELLEGEPSSR